MGDGMEWYLEEVEEVAELVDFEEDDDFNIGVILGIFNIGCTVRLRDRVFLRVDSIKKEVFRMLLLLWRFGLSR